MYSLSSHTVMNTEPVIGRLECLYFFLCELFRYSTYNFFFVFHTPPHLQPFITYL